MPLACENIFAPLVPRPDKPEGVDALAKRTEFLEVVIAGLHTTGSEKAEECRDERRKTQIQRKMEFKPISSVLICVFLR